MPDVGAMILRIEDKGVGGSGEGYFTGLLHFLAVDDDELLFAADADEVFSRLRINGDALRFAGGDALDELAGVHVEYVEGVVARVIAEEAAIGFIDLEVVESALGIGHDNRVFHCQRRIRCAGGDVEESGDEREAERSNFHRR